jgi:hypothetical protein
VDHPPRGRDLKEVAQDSRFLVLDQKLVTSRTQPGGFEACDLLGPHNELIHVKGTRSSAPLSHLFNQGLVAADTFCADPAAWAAFKDKVHDLDPAATWATAPRRSCSASTSRPAGSSPRTHCSHLLASLRSAHTSTSNTDFGCRSPLPSSPDTPPASRVGALCMSGSTMLLTT